MADKTPLKFEFDSTTPSSLAEYTSADTVPVVNGGTGVSSLALLGASLSGIDLSATWVSAGNITATNVSATTVSSTYALFENGVSANSVSATTTITAANAMPLPAPFGYIQLTADDTLTNALQRVAATNTPTTVFSDSSHMSWNDSSKQFEVGAAGTYEVVARVVFEGGSGLVEMKIMQDAVAKNTATPRVHTTVDPVERTLAAIFTCDAGDAIYVTYDSQSSNTVGAVTGTTVTVKRLK